MSAYLSLAPWYDDLTRDVPYGAFADFYEALFKKYGVTPSLLLDLACGTGTLTLELARRGYELIGVDGSEDMLAVAQEKSLDAAVDVKPIFLHQTMETLDLYGTVSAAVCSLDGINYLPPDSLGTVFERLRLFVEPGGLFIFDVNTPEKLSSLDGQLFCDETDDVFCFWRAELVPDKTALRYGLDIFARLEDGAWERGGEEHTEYLHTVETLTEALEAHGFGEIGVFAELRDQPPKKDEQRIFLAARRL